MNKNKLYPLKFSPILKERLWGGSKLRDLLGKPIPNNHTGESWELSGVPGDISVVSNGSLKGKDLQQLIDEYGDYLLGKAVTSAFGRNFPILIKFIDAAKDLSIQVHPNDELAQQRHNSMGKTEMWHVMDADEDARLIIGFKKELSTEEYISSLQANHLPDLLHEEKVNKGDTFMINAGRVHAIGAGVLLAEIQQTSNITYRIYDFNRRNKDGEHRELHTQEALDAIDYSADQDFRVRYRESLGVSNTMVRSPYFNTDYLRLEQNKPMDLKERSSFSIYICVSGKAVLQTESAKVPIGLGETVLIPASIHDLMILTTDVTLLEVTI
ncbi:MAG: type I phosphomannose isomerase catalytic subunit [Flavobacteriaceae bacterium]